MSDLAHGAWAASLTPLNADLSIDHGALAEHVAWLLDNGCAGAAALGTTGEANSFSVPERFELIARLGTVDLAPERILIGVGCCAAPDTIALTRAALAAGFPNVLMLPPFYYKTISDDGLFAAYAGVIEAVNDPRLRIVIYDIPPMTGFALNIDLLRRLRTAFPDAIVGVKNSSGDWSAMQATLDALPGFAMFAGSEQFLLAALRAGGPGCITATANLTARRVGEIAAHWKDDGADALQAALTQSRLALQRFPPVPALKEAMAALGGREAWRRLRPPLVNLAPADAQALIALVRGMNL